MAIIFGGSQIVSLLVYLNNSEPIPADLVHEAASSNNLEELAALNEILRSHENRITSGVDKRICYPAIIRYFLLCMHANSDYDSCAHTRFEAARELCSLLVFWSRLPTTRQREKWINGVVDGVTELFVQGDEDLRNAIESGFLEHVFEHQHLVPLFAHWKSNSLLATAYDFALEWGIAHRQPPK